MPTKDHNLYRTEFPRSNSYDPEWILANNMGPHALWLMEWLTRDMGLQPGMRVLDLGCGKGLTSIFLAREFNVQVWAADLWINPDENWQRIRDAEVEDRVFPLRTEAHTLPFACEFFDAVVSVDAYQYFGTDVLYLSYLSRLVKSGGLIGVAVPGLTQPFTDGIPQHLTEKLANGTTFWEDECNCFLTVAQWHEIWEQSRKVDIIKADTQPDGWRYWRDFENEAERAGKNIFPSVAEALEKDGGRYIGFVRMIGKRRAGRVPFNLYDPAAIATVGKEENESPS